jgi:hypothetical protein
MKPSLILFLLLAAGTSDKRDIQILGPDPDAVGGHILLPHVPPIIYVRQTKGPALPEKGSLSCHWDQQNKDGRPYLVGTCDDNIELIVTGLDLNY